MAAVEVWTFSRRGYGYNCLITVGWAETGERDPGDMIDHVPKYAYYERSMHTRESMHNRAQRHAVGAARLASCS